MCSKHFSAADYRHHRSGSKLDPTAIPNHEARSVSYCDLETNGNKELVQSSIWKFIPSPKDHILRLRKGESE